MTDRDILRDLATQYVAVCDDPIQDERRQRWRQLNSLHAVPPPIYVRAFAWGEMPQATGACTDPFCRRFEDWFSRHLFWAGLDDDSIFEPWVTVPAVHRCSGWGVDIKRHRSGEPRGSFKVDYPLKQLSDIDALRPPQHDVDYEATARQADRLRDLIGDIVTVNVDRGPAYRVWSADISTDLGYLRGIENFMMDMSDDPAGLHRLASFMSEGILRTHDQAEAAGDWSLSAHQNQSMPYAEELRDPAANVDGVSRSELWCFTAAQEFALVSPAMHQEFLLQYQRPIMERFALVAYGCCEDLTNKIDMLRQIPNLRRIAVSPFADVARCADQIGGDYVMSYRPSPTDMVGYGFDEARITGILGRDLAACRGQCADITLKDVETVEHDPDRVRRWVATTRKVIDATW